MARWTTTLSEFVRDDHLAKIFVTTDKAVRINAWPINGTSEADISFGMSPDNFPVTADDCMELGAFLISLSGYLRSKDTRVEDQEA